MLISCTQASDVDRAAAADVRSYLLEEFADVYKVAQCIKQTPADAILERRVADRAPLVDAEGRADIPWKVIACELKGHFCRHPLEGGSFADGMLMTYGYIHRHPLEGASASLLTALAHPAALLLTTTSPPPHKHLTTSSPPHVRLTCAASVSKGMPVTLLGDAFHAMIPSLGQVALLSPDCF